MAILEFPPVSEATEEGLLAIGGNLEVATLVNAYSNGIFPWPISNEYPLTWFSPDPRGILEYKDLHVSKSLKKVLRKNKFEVKFNTDFEEIIVNCARADNRKDQTDTWITHPMIRAYIEFNRAGYGLCVGVYKDGDLVGGIYGVRIGNYCSGESMFYKESNASKVALVSLMEKLHEEGVEWLDTQMVTPITSEMGAEEVPRSEFLERLSAVLPKSSQT